MGRWAYDSASSKSTLDVIITIPIILTVLVSGQFTYLLEHSCSGDPCMYGICLEDVNSLYSCYCIDGYTGINCEINWDDCWSDPCLNGGTCNDAVAAYNCTCPEGFIGTNCEQKYSECSNQPCLNNGTCLDYDGFTCQCPDGYSGDYCEVDASVCNDTICKNFGECVEGPGFSFFCRCPEGWTGHLCDEDVDECVTSPCQNGGLCINIPASYTCACLFGFTGKDCDKAIVPCADNPCRNGAVCLLEDEKPVCYCVPDYHGVLCELKYDDCESKFANCDNGGTCIDGINSYTCACPPHYTGNVCEVYEYLPTSSTSSDQMMDYSTTEIKNGDGYSRATNRGTVSYTSSSLSASTLSPQSSTVLPSTSSSSITASSLSSSSTKTTGRSYTRWYPSPETTIPTHASSDKTVSSGGVDESTSPIDDGSFYSSISQSSITFEPNVSTITVDGMSSDVSFKPDLDVSFATQRSTTEIERRENASYADDGLRTPSSPLTTVRSTDKVTITDSLDMTTGFYPLLTTRESTVGMGTTDSIASATEITDFPSGTSATSTSVTPSTTIKGSLLINRTAPETTYTTPSGISLTSSLSGGNQTTLFLTSSLAPEKETSKTSTTFLHNTTVSLIDGLPTLSLSVTPPGLENYTTRFDHDRNVTTKDMSSTTAVSGDCHGVPCTTTQPTSSSPPNDTECDCSRHEEDCRTPTTITHAAFNGKSYARQRIDVDVVNGNNATLRITLRVRTRYKNGIILHVYFDDERYALVYLETSALKFQFSCGLETMLLGEIDSPIDNGYKVDIDVRFQYFIKDETNRCSARLLVNGTTAVSGEQILPPQETIPRHASLHLGGIPLAFSHYFPHVAMGFIGCMSALKVNDMSRHFIHDSTETFQVEECTSFLCLSNPCQNFGACVEINGSVHCKCIAGYTGTFCERSACNDNPCSLGATCISSPGTGFVCVCPLGTHGLLCEEDTVIARPSFSVLVPGFSSYVAYGVSNSIKDNMELKMRLIPRSVEQISLIAYLGQSGSRRDLSDHLSITYVRGYIMLTWDLGSGVRRIFTSAPIAAVTSLTATAAKSYKPHTVRVGRRGRDAWLSVDGVGNVTGRAVGSMTRLDVSPILYVGGHKSKNFETLPHDLPLHTGFSGCIFDIELRTADTVFPITSSSPATGRGIGECHRNECIRHSCKNGAVCLNHGPTYSCICTKDWTGLDCSVPMDLHFSTKSPSCRTEGE